MTTAMTPQGFSNRVGNSRVQLSVMGNPRCMLAGRDHCPYGLYSPAGKADQ